jgi:uncharacterized protein
MATPTPLQREAVRKFPSGERPVMYQTWSDLLFLHWRVEAAELQKTMPDGLTIDTFDGSAWIGVVPFQMRKIRPAGLFPVPWISYFLELNVRTYVHDEAGNPGVWFYSLETNRWLAYWIARTCFKLPYFNAAMSVYRREDGFLDYQCERKGTDLGSAGYLYRPDTSALPRESAPETLEFFLLERYLLFSHIPSSGALFSGQVNHTPYRYRSVEVPEWSTLPARWDGLPPLTGSPDHACVAEPVDVSVFPLKRI